MRGVKTSIVSALLLSGAAACLAQTDYFPLNPNNQWVYRSSGRMSSEVWTVEVAGSQVIGDKTYTVVKGFPQGDLLLRPNGDGRMYVWNSETKSEDLWLDFSAPAGSTFPGNGTIEPCTGSARIVSREASYKGPVGESGKALQVAYTPSCADAGITEDTFLPYIGLVRRVSTTIAGPVTFDLSYARLGGVTVLSERETAFQLSLDKAAYAPGDQLSARITIRNTQEAPLRLTFPSGQTYDLAIRNEKNETIYLWSAGKVFTQALHTEEVGPGEKNWVLTAPLEQAGQPLPAGKYLAEAWLTTADRKIYSASVGFEIAE